MIARMWHGKVHKERAKDYHQYLIKTGLKDYGAVSGNEGVFLLKKDDADATHFYTLTFWRDYESIKIFAGEEYEKARYYPEDADFLLEFEPFVSHFEVLEGSMSMTRNFKSI
ncbi:MAG: antibiotic biosynthesis monooxygenase [Chryseolinea sp.]